MPTRTFVCVRMQGVPFINMLIYLLKFSVKNRLKLITLLMFQIEVCKSQNTVGWLCALYAYKGIFLIVGVYMAWETRNVKISALNDSKYIGISVYSVVITSISVVVIGTIISERVTIAYITISSLILITTTSTLCLLFLPKILAIRSKGNLV